MAKIWVGSRSSQARTAVRNHAKLKYMARAARDSFGQLILFSFTFTFSSTFSSSPLPQLLQLARRKYYYWLEPAPASAHPT